GRATDAADPAARRQPETPPGRVPPDALPAVSDRWIWRPKACWGGGILSMRPCQLRSTGPFMRSECHRQTGGLAPDAWKQEGGPGLASRLSFPPKPTIYKAVNHARQGQPPR